MNKNDIQMLLSGELSEESINKIRETVSKASEENISTQARPACSTGISEYQGPWGYEQAYHLLSRTIYGPTRAQVQQVVAMGMDAAVDMLLEDLPLPEPPINYDYDMDPNVPIGETWVDQPYTLDPLIPPSRIRSMRAWIQGLALRGEMNVRDKMTMFWHNHYVTSLEVVQDPRLIYKYVKTIQENVLGNYRELSKLITVDPAMLRYLNGFQNTAGSPNENYARELLELFTIGKGPQVGPTDYTTYTEHDVAEAAKILTGWIIRGYNDILGVPVESEFRQARHDRSTKTLSHRFDNAVIQNEGEEEYKTLIDIIFQKQECALFILRKLYRWFVYYDIQAEEETNVIEPLAQELISYDYNIKEVLRILFKSEHFYDGLNCGCMIKSPMDFVTSLFNQFDIELGTNEITRYRIWLGIFNFVGLNQQLVLSPPEVAGWKAYYQEPGFNRIWINSVTLPLRMFLTDIMSISGFNNGNNARIIIDVLDHVSSYENALDPNDLINEAASILYPKELTDNQKTFLKEQLIPGLPDFEWTIEYGDYLEDPENEDLRSSVLTKLQFLFRTLLLLPEYHLS